MRRFYYNLFKAFWVNMGRDYDLNAWLSHKRNKELTQIKTKCSWLIKQGFVALDTETTGLASYDEIIQIGIVDSALNILLDTKINPEIPITPKASVVHGLYREDVADAPMFPCVYPAIASALKDRIVVIYNAEFDKGKLRYMRQKHKLPALKCKEIVDIMPLYTDYCGEYSSRYRSYKWQSLPGGNHSAAGDALALVKLIYRMAEMDIR